MTEQQALDGSVEEVMVTSVHAVDTQTTVKNAALIMATRGYGCLVVVHENLAVGIVTERDIVHKVTATGADPARVLISDVMSAPLITVTNTSTIREAAEKMSAYQVRRIVVVNELGALVGLVTAGDLAKWLARQRNYSDPALNAIARMKGSGTGGPYG